MKNLIEKLLERWFLGEPRKGENIFNKTKLISHTIMPPDSWSPKAAI
jgi:hypothetical protein